MNNSIYTIGAMLGKVMWCKGAQHLDGTEGR